MSLKLINKGSFHYSLSLLVILTIMLGCNSANSRDDRLKKLVNKTICLPGENIVQNKLKIATYIDGNCGVCINNLLKWKKWVARDSSSIDFFFYFYTFDLETMHYIDSVMIKMNYPLIFDGKKQFLSKNGLDENRKEFHTFLLSTENKVLLVGNPLYNKKLAELYRREIEKRTKQQ